MTYLSPRIMRVRVKKSPRVERTTLYWMIPSRERGSRHSFTCAASTVDRLYRICRRSAANSPTDLLFPVNPGRLRIDDSPNWIAEEPVSRLNHSSISFFHLGLIRLRSRADCLITFLRAMRMHDFSRH